MWSNCLAAWILAGGGNPGGNFYELCLGATLLYIGGMFLNDAFDADFDRQYRRERPIPSGTISEKTVWRWGFAWLILGLIPLAWRSQTTAILTGLLMSCIVLYDAVHKRTILAPLLMAACRFFLYVLAGSVAGHVTGLLVWSALVMALYIVGLSYIARAESAPGPLRYWPCVLLVAPLLLAYLVNDNGYRQTGLKLSLIMTAWTVWSVRHIFWTKEKNIGATVSELLAGIVLVDLLNTGPAARWPLAFAALFLLARLFQRFVPAT